MTDQKERADAYYREMVAMLQVEAVTYSNYVAEHGDEDLVATRHRNRIRTMTTTIELIEGGEYHHTTCEACGKPLINGQQVVRYDDVGEVHADCENPNLPAMLAPSHTFNDMFGPERCAAIINNAKNLIAAYEDQS